LAIVTACSQPAIPAPGTGQSLRKPGTVPISRLPGTAAVEHIEMGSKAIGEHHLTEKQLAEVVDAFYARVRRDPELGPIFNGAVEDWDEHLRTLASFWSSVMLTTGRYKGNPMAVHMKHVEAISPALFERWLALWRQTTNEILAPAAAHQLQAKAARIAESLQLGLFFRLAPAAKPKRA